MNKQMNKILEYKKHKLNIGVELNTSVEKHIGGKRYHTIIINDMGVSNYYRKSTVLDGDLISEISKLENDAKTYIDTKINDMNSNDPKFDKRLEDLGFKL